jgi:hypothetical protein
MTDNDKQDDEKLGEFLRNYAPTAAAAPAELEEQLLTAIRQMETTKEKRNVGIGRSFRWWGIPLAAAAAALILALLWDRSRPPETLAPIASDLEESWDGVLADNQDIGMQALFSDLD